jgi:hypothetical protein
MPFRRDFRAMTREALSASSGAALMHCQMHCKMHCKILGGLLLLSVP